MARAVITVTLPAVAWQTARDGGYCCDPGQEDRKARYVDGSVYRRRGFGGQYIVTLSREDMEELGWYLDGVAGALGSMTSEEMGDGGTEMRAALTAVRRIDFALLDGDA